MFLRWMGMIVLLACAGCGSRGIPVKGAVSLDGKPVAEGSIAFEPADGKGATVGAAIHDGRYQVAREAGLQAGQKTARILAVYKTGRRVPAGTPEPTGTMVDEVKTVWAPPKPCEVSDDPEKQLDFELTP